MKVTALELEGVLLVEPARHGDERGWFTETYSAAALAEAGFGKPFVQDNLAFSAHRHTLRGLHFQTPPHAQDKLIRAVRGAILDVAVDIRSSSSTFGRHVAVELSAENRRQLLVPAGFAHGYLTLTEDCEVAYKVSAAYAPRAEAGLNPFDPALAIVWGVAANEARANSRDLAWPVLGDLRPPFS